MITELGAEICSGGRPHRVCNNDHTSVCDKSNDSHRGRGSTVVKVLCYKSEGSWFDPSWCRWIFSSFRSHYGPGVDSVSNRNEYQGYFLGGKGGRFVRLTILPPSCAVVMKSENFNFLEPSGPFQACNGTDLPLPLPNVLKTPIARNQALAEMKFPPHVASHDVTISMDLTIRREF